MIDGSIYLLHVFAQAPDQSTVALPLMILQPMAVREDLR